MTIKENVSLSKHTTFKIGGKARYFVIAKNKEDIIKAVKFAKDNKLSFFVLGRGANVLAPDEGYNGVIIKIQNSKFQVLDSKITAEAGVLLKDLVNFSAENSLSGLEWMAGIPGTVGGAIFGNAKAFDGAMQDNIKKVEALEIKSLKIKKFSKGQCEFSEKNSIFKKNKSFIILSAVLKLKRGSKKEINRLIKKHLNARKKRHPINLGSAGSIFLNRPGKEPSSYLIEKAGLKGRKIGQAEVSKKHAGFIVNLGGARASDVLRLIELVKKEIKRKFKVSLKEEIRVIRNS